MFILINTGNKIMKKNIRFLALALVCLSIALIAAGCSVKGNTYVYEKCEIVGENDLTESQKTTACAAVDTVGKATKYTFNSDGTFGILSYWKQSGSKVYTVGSKDFKIEDGTLIGEIKGGKFVVSYNYENTKFNLIYKKA